MPQEEIRERTIAIASGKYKPGPREPRIWFSSIKSLAQVLSDENQLLLETILKTEPDSITELAKKTGRQLSNLSRTLKTLSNYGIIKLVKKDHKIKPIAKTTQFNIILGMPLVGVTR